MQKVGMDSQEVIWDLRSLTLRTRFNWEEDHSWEKVGKKWGMPGMGGDFSRIRLCLSLHRVFWMTRILLDLWWRGAGIRKQRTVGEWFHSHVGPSWFGVLLCLHCLRGHMVSYCNAVLCCISCQPPCSLFFFSSAYLAKRIPSPTSGDVCLLIFRAEEDQRSIFHKPCWGWSHELPTGGVRDAAKLWSWEGEKLFRTII